MSLFSLLTSCTVFIYLPISLHWTYLGRPSAFLFNLPLASCRTRHHHHHYNNLSAASNPIHNNVKTSKCLMTSKYRDEDAEEYDNKNMSTGDEVSEAHVCMLTSSIHFVKAWISVKNNKWLVHFEQWEDFETLLVTLRQPYVPLVGASLLVIVKIHTFTIDYPHHHQQTFLHSPKNQCLKSPRRKVHFLHHLSLKLLRVIWNTIFHFHVSLRKENKVCFKIIYLKLTNVLTFTSKILESI